MSDISLYNQQGLSEPGILSKIAVQINKDFGSFGQEVYDDKMQFNSVHDLFQPLLKQVTGLLQDDKRKMMQIIYRVDINENQLGTALAEAKGEDAALLLTELIIARESKKVQIRQQSR